MPQSNIHDKRFITKRINKVPDINVGEMGEADEY
jgi:hypothetical protein